MLLDIAPCRKLCEKTEEEIAEKKIRREDSLGSLEGDISSRQSSLEEVTEEFTVWSDSLRVILSKGPKPADKAWIDFLQENIEGTLSSPPFLSTPNVNQLPVEEIVMRISNHITKLAQKKQKLENAVKRLNKQKESKLRHEEKLEKRLKRKVKQVFCQEQPEQKARCAEKKTLGCTVGSLYLPYLLHCKCHCQYSRIFFGTVVFLGP